MLSSVKSFTLSYNHINEKNIFTNGDYVSGNISLEVTKQCLIKSLLIKFKGKAEVRWTERYGQTTVVYHAKNKYFSVKNFFIRESKNKDEDNQTLLTDMNGRMYSNVVAPGHHVYTFTFQIPFQDLPSSFESSVGKVIYLLEARLSRSMRVDNKASVKINIVPKVDPNSIAWLMAPQHDSKDKRMKFFSSGTICMDVNIEKTGYQQGEGMKIVAIIQNTSSRVIKPKYCIYRKHSFFANGRRKVHTTNLLEEVGEPVPPMAKETVTRIITIPLDAETSILNCQIIKVEHRLRVYLDVKFASNPEIKFPIVILPASQAPAMSQQPPYEGYPAFPHPDQPMWNPQAQNPVAPSPFDAPPPPYGACALYPSIPDDSKK